MKVKFLIAVLFGSLILVNIGHNIIPHHHHLDDMHSHTGCEQHDVPNHTEHQPADRSGDHAADQDPAHHCHAFNGFEYVLSFDKRIKKESLTKITSVQFLSFALAEIRLPRQNFCIRFESPPPNPTGYLGESSGLRAPPSIS